ncbi:MAG: C10 family peptidase [Bacteroidales bacterium]|nr:C10 family peptidase [Bacteroidales bacterium]
MKKIVLLLFLLSLGLSVFCSPVSIQTAQRAAEAYWGLMNGGKVSFVGSQTEFTEFYVFNNQIGEGFVLVSADDIAHPILGYSDKGSFRTDVQLPVNVRGWFKGISKEISSAVALGVQQNDEVREEWNSLLDGTPYPKRSTRAVSALLSTTWDQGKPYNNLCPADSNTDSYYGGRTVTGCVATAMAQVMKYWNYPTQGTGSNSYSSSYGTLSANFANTTYDWANMPNNLTNYSSSTQKTAVATLMYHCGISVNMQYDIAENGGSGAYTVAYGTTPCAKTALVNYFKYKSTIQGLFRQSYSDTNWKNLLKADLDAGRPIMYSGASDEGGHSFVCDGYNNSDQFHFNWGWSGDCDGFFSLNAMTPGSTGGIGGGGYDFSEDQDAIIGIEPAGISVNPTSVQIPSAGGSATVTVTAGNANSAWTATSSASWVSFTPTTGSGNGASTTMTISASANNTGSTRTATITLTQGSGSSSQTATVTVSQLDGTVSLDGWYGNVSGYDNITDITANHEIIIRPEQFGTFEPGNKVLKVKFATYQTSTGNYASYNNNSFTLRIYEGTNLDNGLVTNGYSLTENILNTPVYTQNYTQTPDAESSITENTITLNTPYTLNNNNFWISIVANGPTLFLYEEETIGSPVATASFNYDATQANYDYLYTETYTNTQNNTNYELINANYGAGYTDNSQAYVQAASMNFALAFYLSEDGTYTETSDFQAELFGGVSGGYLQEAPSSYTISATDNLVIYPFFKNAGPDAATSGTITVAIKLNGNTYTSISNDASQLSVGSWYSMASSGYSVTIPASDMDDLNLTGNFNVCVEITYSGTDSDLSNNSHCIPVTRQEPSAYNLSVSPSSLSYIAAGESKTITVTSNTSWTATSSASWLTISPASGSNNGTITAVAAANTSTTQRTATITVSGSGVNAQTISVTQAGNGGSGDPVSSFTYDFEACTAWTVDQFSPCTTYDGDGSTTGGIRDVTFENQGYTGSYIVFENGLTAGFEAHGGTKFGCCMYATTPPNNDWFITPAISISNGTTFSFWARSANDSYGLEQFKVGISNNNTSFNTYLAGSSSTSESAPVTWTQYTYDLSSYAGQTMYIAIMCVSSDVFAFFIDDIVVESSTPSYNLTVSPSSLVYAAEGGSQTANVTSNVSWTATSSASWLTVSPASGSNNGTITIVAAPNTTNAQRTATITVSGQGVTAQAISVIQNSAAAIDEEVAESISVYPNPTNGMFTVGLGSIEGKATCQIVNINGSIIETREVNTADNSEIVFDCNVNSGVYFVRIISGNNVWTKRVVIEK